MYKIKVTEELKGKRTDKLLAEQLPQFPRAALSKLFSQELVLLNDIPTRPGIKVKIGDSLSADLSPLDIKIEDIDLPIIYEDENILVIDKPSGVISHARGRYFDEPSVASFVRQKTGQKGERSGIVHRLDRATSGVMITAKNQETLSMLQKQFSQRKVYKSYLALIEGSLPTEEGIIDMPIGRNPKVPQTFHVTPAGKNALTRYKVLQQGKNYSLVELRPETGRTHQLRVHLAELKRPILGDALYKGAPADRLMLHAASLEITIPTSKRKVFTSNIPSEFNNFIEK